MKYIGIDPGKDGGIAIIQNNNLTLHSIPTIKKKEVDIDLLDKLLFDIRYQSNEDDDEIQTIDCMCVLEEVHSIHKSSANSNFQFGLVFGILMGLLTANRIPFIKIAPKEWQSESWKGVKIIKNATGKKLKNGQPQYKIDTKGTSLIAAKRLFPNETFLATSRSSVPHDGLVDAALIAWFCKIKY